MNAPVVGLTQRALRGLSWNYLGTGGRIVATFVSQIILARLLGPEQFGLFGYAFLTVSLLALVVEMGLQLALVQVPQLDDEVIGIACGRLLLSASFAALCVYLLSDMIALYVFSAPQAAPVLRAMAPTLVVGVVTAVANAMLSREIEFKVIQLAALGSYVVGYLIVGIGAALYGLGVWSLVLAWHVQTLLACITLCACSPRSLLPSNPFKSLRIAGFGYVVMVTNMINWLIDLGPHTAIGRMLGASMLGQYTLASNLVKVPADHLVRNLQTVLFPLAARAQDNDAGLRRAYLSVLAGVGVVSFPVFVFVAAMSQPIVLLLLGPKWGAAADVLAPLSLAMIGHAVEALCGPILGGRGDPRVELRIKAVTLAMTLVMLAITATWSLAAVAWGVAIVYFLRWLWMNAAVMSRLNISMGEFANAMRGSFALGAISWAVASAVSAAFSALAHAAPALWVLAAAAAVTAVVIVATLLTMPRVVLGTHLLALIDQLVEQRPAFARIPGLRRVASFSVRAAP